MTRAKRQSFDVFLAHDPLDNALATAVISRLAADGLTTFSPNLSESRPLDPTSELVRQELQDSFNFVVLLTTAFAKSETLPFLLGAAVMASSPVHVLADDTVAQSSLPYLGRYPIVPLWAGIDRLIARAGEASAPFSADLVEAVKQAYARTGTTVDEILVEPAQRTKFAREFHALSDAEVTPERLLRELVRLRKRSQLPRRMASVG